jgi:hypothetical protein
VVGNKMNAELLGGKQRECLFCEVGNHDNADFVRWETKRMLIL